MPSKARYEVVVVGGGIAGASFVHFLSERGVTDVLLVEREESHGYHSSGRSAAMLYELDPLPVIQQLKRRGGDWLRSVPEGFSENRILDRRGALTVFRGQIWEALQHLVEELREGGLEIDLVTKEEAVARVEVLSPEAFDGGSFMPGAGGIDVHELLSCYLRHAKGRGVEVECGVEVTGVLTGGGRCTGVRTRGGDVRARWVVNAAGAWAGVVAKLAGAAPIEITPKRRCAFTFAAPADLDVTRWPIVSSEHHQIYFEPEPTGLLMSPMDEVPMEPCDARPDDLTIAEGVERLREVAPRVVPRSIQRKWAGLRTFTSDCVPVVGRDPTLSGFFWLAGQGGCGIETSGALGQIAVDLLLDDRTERFDESVLRPERFA